MKHNESQLSEFACRSDKGIKLKEEAEDIRPAFFRDIDKIIHSRKLYEIY